VTDETRKPVPGYTFAEMTAVKDDSVSASVRWKTPLAALKGRTVHLEFSLTHAKLFAFDVQ
jgi:hypothetical protein